MLSKPPHKKCFFYVTKGRVGKGTRHKTQTKLGILFPNVQSIIETSEKRGISTWGHRGDGTGVREMGKPGAKL